MKRIVGYISDQDIEMKNLASHYREHNEDRDVARYELLVPSSTPDEVCVLAMRGIFFDYCWCACNDTCSWVDIFDSESNQLDDAIAELHATPFPSDELVRMSDPTNYPAE